MRIRVSVTGRADRSVLEDDEYLRLEDDAVVRTVYRKLKIPVYLRPLMKCWVNYKPAKMSDRLNEGDEVMFLIIASGG